MFEVLAGFGVLYLIYLLFYAMFTLVWWALVAAFYVVAAVVIMVAGMACWTYEVIQGKRALRHDAL